MIEIVFKTVYWLKDTLKYLLWNFYKYYIKSFINLPSENMKNYANLAEIAKLICHSQLCSTGYTYSLYKHHVRFNSLTHLDWSKQFSIFRINMHIIYIIFYKYLIIYANQNDLMKTNKPSTHFDTYIDTVLSNYWVFMK